MAGVQWSSGSMTRRKMYGTLLHNSKDTRLEHQHTNEDIDPKLTPYNWSVLGRTYAQKVSFYERRMSEVDYGRESSGKNERIVAHDLIVYCPPEVEAQGMDAVREFFKFSYATLAELVGVENVIDMDVHVDERHDYIDPDTGETVRSRIHGHFTFVPVVTEKDVRVREKVQAKDDDGNLLFETVTDEDGTTHEEPVWERDRSGRIKRRGGKVQHVTLDTPELNDSAVATRDNIMRSNQLMDEMCKERFSCTYTTGKAKKRRGKTVEQLKIDSALAADKAAEDAEARRAEAEDQLGEQAAGLVDASTRVAETRSELDVVEHELSEATDELELARKDRNSAKNQERDARRRTEGLEKQAKRAIADRDMARTEAEALRASADAYAAKRRAEADEDAQRTLEDAKARMQELDDAIDEFTSQRTGLVGFVRRLPTTIRNMKPSMPEAAAKVVDSVCNWLEKYVTPLAEALVDQYRSDLQKEATMQSLKVMHAARQLRDRQAGPGRSKHTGTKTGPIRTQQQAQRSRNRSHGGSQLGR